MHQHKACWVFGIILVLAFQGCSEKSSSFTDSGNPDDVSDTLDDIESDGDGSETGGSKDTASNGVESSDSEALVEGDDTFVESDDASSGGPEDTEEESWEDEDTLIVITEDGGVGGSGIYPPKEIPELLGGNRPAQVAVPLDYDVDSSYPLVLNLHGYTGNADQIDNYFNLSAYVTSRDFVLVTPEGTTDQDGFRFWNSPDCCNKYGKEVDDLAYLMGLIEEAKETLSIDPDRVYLIGLSNGAFMAHYIACQYPETIAGIAALAGVSPKSAVDCSPDASVGVLQIHGTLDSVIPFDGTFFYNSAGQTAANWRDHNACDGAIVTEEPPANYDYLVPGKETVKTSWTACGSGNAVSLWALELSAHVPYLHPDFTPDVLTWLFTQTNQVNDE